MANLLLTERCVRSCPYCFAKKQMADADGEDVLSWEDLIYLADFLKISNEPGVSLLGGEPTLHPHYLEFVIYLLERGFRVNTFTSGVMSEQKLNSLLGHLGGVPPEHLSFVCNVNEPALSPASELKSVERFLSAMGHLTSPGFNIYHTDFNLDFIFDYVNRFGLRRHLRLGLAHPIPGKQNQYVTVDDFGKMVDKLLSYAPMFDAYRITPGLDCGFPMCAFTDAQLGTLFRLAGGKLTFGCGPAIDIGPDMKVWACFPLSEFHRKSIFEFDTLQDVQNYYHHKHSGLRVEAGGIYHKCDDCRYRHEGLCSGGCAAHLLSWFKNEAKVRWEEIYK